MDATVKKVWLSHGNGGDDMDATVKKVWLSHGNGGDEWHSGPVIGVFTNKSDAEENSKGRGWYGGTGYVCEGKAVVFEGGTCYVITGGKFMLDLKLADEEKAAEEKRKQALSKLTPEEIKLLRIK